MKRLIFGCLFLLKACFSWAQSVTILPGAQAINGTEVSNNQLDIEGNGLVIEQKNYVGTNPPEANLITMNCANVLNTNSIAGILVDPSGEAKYTAGVNYNCQFEIDPGNIANLFSLKISFVEFNTEADGDSLIITSGLDIMKYSGAGLPETIFLNEFPINFTFKTDNDAHVGTGFKIVFQPVFRAESAKPIQNFTGGNSLFFSTQSGAFRAGGYVSPSTKGIGDYSAAFGFASRASGENSFAAGYKTKALGLSSTALGSNSKASNWGSVSIGSFTHSSGRFAVSMGIENTASGNFSLATGDLTTASGHAAMSGGFGTTASGGASFAFGNGTIARAVNSFSIGSYNEFDNPGISSALTDRIFQIGNGVDNLNRKNVLTVLRNGKIGVGTVTPAALLEVNGYTKLGSDAPSIKIKKYTGTTVASQGNCSTTVALSGIADAKVLDYAVIIDWQSTDWVKEGYTYDPGQEFYVYHKNGELKICLQAANSFNIINKPYRALVTYEE